MTRNPLRQDWTGLLLVVIAGSLAIAALKLAFLSSYNIQVLLAAVAINTMVALSQEIIIAIGQMNPSTGALGGLAAIAFAGGMEVWGLPWPVALALGLAIGLGGGLLNGWLVVRTGISAFVVTLATLYIFGGVTMGITEAQPFYGVAEPVKRFGDAIPISPVPPIALPSIVVAVALGWHQQKVSVATWLAAGARILIADEPSVGIDIKTKAYLRQLLRELSDQGTAILLVTSDRPAMITFADRIAVMDGFRVTGEVANSRVYSEMSAAIMGLTHREAA